jgi:hypothetical protein
VCLSEVTLDGVDLVAELGGAAVGEAEHPPDHGVEVPDEGVVPVGSLDLG